MCHFNYSNEWVAGVYVMQCVAVCCSVLQCVAFCFSRVHLKAKILQCVLQCVAGVLQYVAGVLRCVANTAVCCSGLHWVAVCCSGLQWVAVCCSVSFEDVHLMAKIV